MLLQALQMMGKLVFRCFGLREEGFSIEKALFLTAAILSLSTRNFCSVIIPYAVIFRKILRLTGILRELEA